MSTPLVTSARSAPRAPAHLFAAAVLASIAGAALAAPTAVTSPAPDLAEPARERFGLGLPPVACNQTKLEQAMRLVASQAADPGAAMLAMRVNLLTSPACFKADITPEQLADILSQYQALPPVIAFEGGLRFFSQNTVWSGDVTLSPTGRAARARLTYSFPPDNAFWDGQVNILNATLAQNFGPNSIDRGREVIRQSFAAWRRHGGLTYQEVADDGTSRTSSTTRVASRGDIRIGGNDIGNIGVIAYNYFPASGGDMLINTFYFIPGDLGRPGQNYRVLRNVIGHEHGHGLGYLHVIPCEQNKLMEPFTSTNYDMLTVDERRGVGRNYGDRLSGNHSPADAHDLGNLSSPAPRSFVERDLTTNGIDGAFGSSADWFKFTLSSPQPVVITAAPTGGSYNQGEQIEGCMGLVSLINASQAGNLNIELRDQTGNSILQSAAAVGPGGTEVLDAGVLPAGMYTLRVQDVGPNNHFTVQLYDLTVRVADAVAPPQAIAGINKRIRAGVNCYFMGQINSRPLEQGATIVAYDWDLDGNGSFETPGAEANRQYVSNGVHDVTLRVTDSNGRTATDTITVTVFGATTSVTGVTPFGGLLGQTVPVTISGTNLKNVTSASMVTVSGNGVSVTGTPVPNSMGTRITGLSFVIAGSAPLTARDITIANADGVATGEALFTVGLTGTTCPVDWNADGLVNSGDISGFLGAWLASVQNGTLAADFNGDQQVNSADISAFLGAWLSAVQQGC